MNLVALGKTLVHEHGDGERDGCMDQSQGWIRIQGPIAWAYNVKEELQQGDVGEVPSPRLARTDSLQLCRSL